MSPDWTPQLGGWRLRVLAWGQGCHRGHLADDWEGAERWATRNWDQDGHKEGVFSGVQAGTGLESLESCAPVL